MSAGLLRTLAAVFACVAVLLAFAGWRLGQGADSIATTPAVTAPEQTASVAGFPALVVTSNLSSGDLLSAANTSIAIYPSHLEGSFSALEAVPQNSVLRAVPRGKVLMVDDFLQTSPLAHLLEPGKRGVAVSVDELIAVGGHLKPGDKVDVLYSAPSPNEDNSHGARMLFSGLTLLSVGQRFSGETGSTDDASRSGQPAAARTVVLEIEESLAPVLLLAENTGRLRLALVGSQESTVIAQDLTRTAQLESTLGPFFYLNDVVQDAAYEAERDARAVQIEHASATRQVQMYVGGQSSSTQLPVK